MNQGELRQVLEAVVAALDLLGISYHVTGGLASSFYGEPRLTQDIDFVVAVAADEIGSLAAQLDGMFLLDADRATRAVETGGMFQALHRQLLIKADFHVGEDVPGELDRSREVEIFEGLAVRLVSKEDAIVSKLLWTMRGSGKSRDDVRGMLLDPTPFDEDLVRKLADRLGCADLLREIQSGIG